MHWVELHEPQTITCNAHEMVFYSAQCIIKKNWCKCYEINKANFWKANLTGTILIYKLKTI